MFALMLGLSWPLVSAAGTTSCLANGVQPSMTDTDGDGIPDVHDRVPDDPTNACFDYDSDGLNDLREYWLGTNPENANSDYDETVLDRLSDGDEVRWGLDPLDPHDAVNDADGDGYQSDVEVRFGTDPLDANSVPAPPGPFLPGQYVMIFPSSKPIWGSSGLVEFIDFAPDGTVVYIDGEVSATGNWSISGPTIDVVFDPGQVYRWLARTVQDDQGGLIQVEAIQYFVRASWVRSVDPDGRAAWVRYIEYREETPALDLVKPVVGTYGKPWIATERQSLPQMSLSAGAYALPCPNGPDVVSPGSPFFYTCRIQTFGDGTGTNLDAGVPVSIGLGADGAQIVRYGDGSASHYYMLEDFGSAQLVAVLQQSADGKLAAHGGMMTERNVREWPGALPGDYQYTQGFSPTWGDYALEFLADGTLDSAGYNVPLGEWIPSYWGQWERVGEQVVAERFYTLDQDGNYSGIVRDPATCQTQTCYVFWRRTITPEHFADGELIVTHLYEFYDYGAPGLDILSFALQDLRSFQLTSRDLDLDGIPDSDDLDDDGDGLPDLWELDYYGSSLDGYAAFYELDGDSDPDGDGYTNAEEYANGTDPLMPDAPPVFEGYLAVLGTDAGGITLGASLHDPFSGVNTLSTFNAVSGQVSGRYAVPDAGLRISGLSAVEDVTSGGVADLAVLGRSANPASAKLFVRAGEDGGFVKNVTYFDAAWTVQDARVLPDLAGGAFPDIAVLGRNGSTGEIAAQVKDSVTGSFVRNVFFLNDQWIPRQLMVLDNLDSNPGKDLGVLATSNTGQIVVMLKDAATNSFIRNSFFFNANWEPIQALVLPDFNGNAVEEIGLLARNRDSGMLVVMVRDGATSSFLNNVFPFGGGWTPIKAEALPDENGNGSVELATLAANDATGKLIVQVRDSSTGQFLRNMTVLGSNWEAKDMVAVEDLGTGAPGLSVLAVRKVDGVPVVQTINGTSGALVSNTFLN